MTPSTILAAIVAIVAILAAIVATYTATAVQVSSSGEQQSEKRRNITFLNKLSAGDASLFWLRGPGGGIRNAWPLIGGARSIEAYPGQTFALGYAGTLEILVEFTVGDSGGPDQFAVTDADTVAPRSKSALGEASESAQREAKAMACRAATTCEECTAVIGCGYSTVRRGECCCASRCKPTSSISQQAAAARDPCPVYAEVLRACRCRGACLRIAALAGCFLSHPIATQRECQAEAAPAESKSIEAWLNQAAALELGRQGYGPRALHAAYRAVERAVEAAALAVDSAAASSEASKAAEKVARRARSALAELTPKLEAVFDDMDAREVLASTRHPGLAAVHPEMRMVDRRTLSEARAYVSRGEAVIITDLSADLEVTSDASGSGTSHNPVAQKWTLEYLNRRVMGDTASGGGGTGTGAGGAGGGAAGSGRAGGGGADGGKRPPLFNVATDAVGRYSLALKRPQP